MKIPVQNTQVKYKTPVVYNFLPLIKVRAFSLNTEWFISDLIPKKSEKLKFRKNFVTIFFTVKN